MKITINAGHYPGLDSGAVGASGLQEADVTKDIAGRVVDLLKSVGHNALFVQKNELYEITQLSNDFGADLFISIHCNAAENTDARGTETFAYTEGGDSDRLAACIQLQIIDSMGTVDHGVKYHAGLYVLRNTNCPAVLVECAFISNNEDEALLASEDGKGGFARAIARGITDYAASI